MRAQQQPLLVVGELVLRPWQAGDAEALVEAYSDPAIQRWHMRTMTQAQAARWLIGRREGWARETCASWAITRQDRVVGRVEVKALDLAGGSGEAAYWVIPSARGREVASRALLAVTVWLFENVGLHRIELLHSTRNEASCRVAEKAGYQLEGTKREAWLFADGWHDAHLHACVGGL